MKYNIKDTNYALVEGNEINGGGFNKIYECSLLGEDGSVINDNLVLKRLINELDFHQNWRLDREMRYIEKLDHENILKPFYCDYDEGFIVMERFPMNLHGFIEMYESSEKEYLKIFSDILNGVQYYISEGVLHRDLKPHNILIDHNNDVKITDFGLSSKIDRENTLQHLTMAGQFGGTQFFSAPEQLETLTEADQRSDIYSLGKIIYVLATRDLTYHDLKFDIVNPQLRYLIKKATKYKPEERFQSIEDFIKSFNMIYKVENNVSLNDYQLDNIVKEINSEVRKEEPSDESFQKVFEHISNPEYNDVVELMVKLDVDTHSIMWRIDSDSYTEFMVNACNAIKSSGFLFSFVDDIVSTLTSILEELKSTMDIELQAQIISASVEVSTGHNRYWAMQVIAKFISEIENPILLVNLKNGEHAIDNRNIKKISQYHESENLDKLMIVE